MSIKQRKMMGRELLAPSFNEGGLSEAQEDMRSEYSHNLGDRPALERDMESVRHSPPSRQERVRTHAELASAKSKDPDLSDGLSLRVPLTDMDKSIDDGVES